MSEEKGTKVVGDPSVAEITADDIVSVGTATPQTATGAQPAETPGMLDNLGKPNATPEPPTDAPSTPPETVPPVTTEAPAQTTPVEIPPEETAPPAAVDPWSEVFTSLKNDNGIEFQSKDHLVTELSQYAKYKQDPLGFLDPEVKAHAEFIKAGGDTKEFYRLKSIDFESLSPKETLFHSFLKDHPEYAKDQEFARMYFKRDYDQKFGILNDPKKTQEEFVTDLEEPDPVAYRNYLDEYTFAEKLQVVESNASKETLVSWQKASTSPPKNPNTGYTEDEVAAFKQQYDATVEQVKHSYKGEEIPISDKPEDNLKFGLNEKVKPLWENDLHDPMSFLNDIGLKNDGQVDLEKLSKASYIFRMWPHMGPIAKKLITERNLKAAVTGESTAATPIGTAAPGDAHGDDELQEVADLISRQEYGRGPR